MIMDRNTKDQHCRTINIAERPEIEPFVWLEGSVDQLKFTACQAFTVHKYMHGVLAGVVLARGHVADVLAT